jgi:hypothetical protein
MKSVINSKVFLQNNKGIIPNKNKHSIVHNICVHMYEYNDIKGERITQSQRKKYLNTELVLV